MKKLVTLSFFLASLVLGAALPVAAQTNVDAKARSARPDPQKPVGENMEVPPAWKVRLDTPDPDVVIGAEEGSDIRFITMTPGWHITTGPRAIFYHPASTAEGYFVARAGIHLFPPGDRNEAYGLFVGGKNLEADGIQYLYFLVRRSGEFLIKRRDGDQTEVLHEWTANEVINAYEADTEGTVHNALSIEAGPEEVSFMVNDVEVATMPRSQIDVDGIVGLRVNHALNVHVDDFGIELRD